MGTAIQSREQSSAGYRSLFESGELASRVEVALRNWAIARYVHAIVTLTVSPESPLPVALVVTRGSAATLHILVKRIACEGRAVQERSSSAVATCVAFSVKTSKSAAKRKEKTRLPKNWPE